ncbi:hypothetical protein CEXT_653591 [Caerostris extrusa]|uniref:Uncharacterized protein n=1 Tax=Caerostris extrusa TaxID=172846 RepID=A0AAV4N8R2_CAEEX|nr:hypothetical protein CEXT_653591 [Caerostris extrusa]
MSDGQSSYLSSSPTDGILSRISGRSSAKHDDSFTSDVTDSSEHRFGRGTPLKSVPEDERLLTSPCFLYESCLQEAGSPTRKPHRTPLEGACGLEDIRQGHRATFCQDSWVADELFDVYIFIDEW